MIEAAVESDAQLVRPLFEFRRTTADILSSQRAYRFGAKKSEAFSEIDGSNP
jgi:hypothetical protein